MANVSFGATHFGSPETLGLWSSGAACLLLAAYKFGPALYAILRSVLCGIRNGPLNPIETVSGQESVEDGLNERRSICDNENVPKSMATPPKPKPAKRKQHDLTRPLHWNDNWDGWQNRSGDRGATTPTATRRYLLIRHGEYNNNNKTVKPSERKLTSLGREQALITGEKIRDLGLPIDKIFSSTMSRAQETSCLIQKALPSIDNFNTNLLCEGTFRGPHSNSCTHGIDKGKKHNNRSRIEEAFHQFFHRASPCQKEDCLEMYVCHRNVIQYFVCRVLQYPEKEWPSIDVPHCSMTFITIRPDGNVSLDILAYVGHIPPAKVTPCLKIRPSSSSAG